MELYPVLRLVHILSASVLFGSGMAIAFFMLMAWRAGDRAAFALTAKHVVLADWVFTATAVVVHTQAAQVAAAQPFLHFCGSAICADQVCDLASRCGTVQAAPLQSASSSLVCTTAGAAS